MIVLIGVSLRGYGDHTPLRQSVCFEIHLGHILPSRSRDSWDPSPVIGSNVHLGKSQLSISGGVSLCDARNSTNAVLPEVLEYLHVGRANGRRVFFPQAYL